MSKLIKSAKDMSWAIQCPDCDAGRTWVPEFEGDESPCTYCKYNEQNVHHTLANEWASEMVEKYQYRNCSPSVFVNLYSYIIGKEVCNGL